MTQRDLDAKAVRQARTLAGWAARAVDLIGGKLADARAHAARSVTETLRGKADGRATLRHAARNPSFRAALDRLDELLDALAGPTSASLAGLLRDARAAAYAEAFEAWKPFIPEELWASPEAAPTAAGRVAARAMVLHGVELRKEVGAAIDRAKRDLSAAVALAGRRGADDRLAADLLGAWERRAVAAIAAVVRLALSDGQVAADTMAGRDLVHDDFLEPLAAGAGA